MRKFLALFACASILVGLTAPSATAAGKIESTARPLDELVKEDPDFARYLSVNAREEKAIAEGDPVSDTSNRTANLTPDHDQRIASLWWRDEQGLFRNKSDRYCTAAHIAERWWITARHCVPGYHIGFLETTDGSFAGIERWWFPDDSKYDFALLRVGTGLTSKPKFKLPDRPLSKGEVFTVTGFAAIHSFASSSTFKKEADNLTETFNADNNKLEFSHVTRAVVNGSDPYPVLPGDSGGPSHVNGVVYGTTTGSNERDTYWQTEIFDLKPWIQKTISEHPNSELGDIWDAFHGGRAALDDKRKADRITEHTPVHGSSYGSS